MQLLCLPLPRSLALSLIIDSHTLTTTSPPLSLLRSLSLSLSLLFSVSMLSHSALCTAVVS